MRCGRRPRSRELGEDRVVATRPDGAVELSVPAANLDAFRSWVLGLLQHAVVLGPPDVREPCRRLADRDRRPEPSAHRPIDRRFASVSSPRNAEERLQRLLVMLPWLMEVGEVPLADVARRFDMTEADVQKNLELVAMCGLPPFVDEMIDVFVDEGIVYVGVPRLFTRPLRLTAPEGFALLASARAAMELPGADAMARSVVGLAKLAAVLDDVGLDTGDVTAGVAVDLDRPEITDDLAEYAADRLGGDDRALFAGSGRGHGAHDRSAAPLRRIGSLVRGRRRRSLG